MCECSQEQHDSVELTFIGSYEVNSTAKSLQHWCRALGTVYEGPISAYLDSNEIKIVQADDLTQDLQSRPCQRRYYYQLGCHFSLHWDLNLFASPLVRALGAHPAYVC